MTVASSFVPLIARSVCCDDLVTKKRNRTVKGCFEPILKRVVLHEFRSKFIVQVGVLLPEAPVRATIRRAKCKVLVKTWWPSFRNIENCFRLLNETNHSMCNIWNKNVGGRLKGR